MVRIKQVTTINNAGGLQTVLELQKITTDEIGIEIANSNVNDLTAFAVQVRFDEDGSYVTVASAAADYTSPVFGGFIRLASGSLVTLAKNTSGWLALQGMACVESLRIQATGAAAATVLTITGKMR